MSTLAAPTRSVALCARPAAGMKTAAATSTVTNAVCIACLRRRYRADRVAARKALLRRGPLARIHRETVGRVALVGVDVILPARERHDARRRAFERPRVGELLRDHERIRIR